MRLNRGCGNLSLSFGRESRQPEKQDSGVETPLSEYQLSEIFIRGQ
mgnify:CR=1 FL=1